MSKTFTVRLVQYVQEICEIEVDAVSQDAAEAAVQDSITLDKVDDDYDLDWSDGFGTHPAGVIIDEVYLK